MVGFPGLVGLVAEGNLLGLGPLKLYRDLDLSQNSGLSHQYPTSPGKTMHPRGPFVMSCLE